MTARLHTSTHVTVRESGAYHADWRHARACTDVDAELFYPTEHVTSTDPAKLAAAWAPARAICATCPVTTDCLEDALGWESWGTYYRHGMRGGLTPRERSNLARSRQRKAKREATA